MIFRQRKNLPYWQILSLPRARIELATQGFSVLRSTTELPRQGNKRIVQAFSSLIKMKEPRVCRAPVSMIRLPDKVRNPFRNNDSRGLVQMNAHNANVFHHPRSDERPNAKMRVSRHEALNPRIFHQGITAASVYHVIPTNRSSPEVPAKGGETVTRALLQFFVPFKQKDGYKEQAAWPDECRRLLNAQRTE